MALGDILSGMKERGTENGYKGGKWRKRGDKGGNRREMEDRGGIENGRESDEWN